MVGPYRVLHQIGSGVLGPVYRVLDPDADAIVALKLFKFDWPPEQAHALAGGLQTLIETLPPHPSIVAPLAAGLDGSTAWLAQDLAAADGLDARMRRRTAVGAEALVAVLRQVASAIDTAAEAGWRHGALHPRDVLVDTTGRVRVTGIGIAQVVERFGAKPPRRRPYGAPERTAGQAWDVRADVFALGVIAAEWLAPRRGRPGAEPLAVTLERAGFDGEAAVQVLEAATAARPEDRPPSALAFVDALGAAIDVVRLARTRTPAPGLLFAEAGPAGAPATAAPWPGEPLPGADEDLRLRDDGAPDLALRADEGQRLGEEPATAEAAADEATLITPAVGRAESGPPEDETDHDLQVEAGDSDQAVGPDAPLGGADDLSAVAATSHAGEGERELDLKPSPRTGHGEEEEVRPASAAVHDEGEPPLRDDRARGPEVVEIGGHHADPWGFSPHSPEPPAPAAQTPRTPQWLAALGAVLLLGLALGFMLGRWSASPAGPAGAPTPAASAPAGVEPSTAEIRDEPVVSEPASGPAAGQPAPSTAAASPVAPGARATAPRPVDGRLVVRTTPSGARVRVDGRDRGTTPLTLRGLAAGDYRLEISRQGYAPESRRVTISGRRPSADVEVRLRAERPGAPAPAARASVEFVTRPPGARVLLDGRQVGVTPLTLADVPPGTRTVRFELAGHAPWVATVALAPGESRRVAASLEPVQ